MPVSGWKVHMVWQDGAQAIGEDYYWNGASDNPVTTVYPAAVKLMTARSAMMGNGILAVTFRISQVGVFRSYINANPADVAMMQAGPLALAVAVPLNQTAVGIGTPQDGSADQANACISMTAYSTPQSHSRKFLAGVPDVLIRTNPQGPFIVGVASWGNL